MKDKDYAEIYDFITLPRPLDEVSSLTTEEMEKELSLVKNELMRAEEFAHIAMNSMHADQIIQRLRDVYHLHDEKLEFSFE